jgi:hypothetical protein
VRTLKLCLSIVFLLPTAAMSGEQLPVHVREQVRALHGQVITPASDALFEAEREIPGTDHHWQQLQGIAKELAKAGDRLLSINDGKVEKNWLAFATALRDEAEAIARAAGAKNHEAIVAGNGRLQTTCETCHAEFRGDGK